MVEKTFEQALVEALAKKQASNKTIGTSHYDGHAYFWHSEYKHKLRDCSVKERIVIHNLLLENNLQLNGTSDLHDEIIWKTKKYIRAKKLTSLLK